jgi:hypothetical protein
LKSTVKQLEPESTVKTTTSLFDNTETPEIEPSSLSRAQNEIEVTYTAHVEALKGFEDAFKNMARQDKIVYREAEKRFQAYKNAVELALKNRETTEKVALSTYRNTVNRAVEIYRMAMQRALIECQQATEKAGALLTSLPGAENKKSNKYFRFMSRFWNSVKDTSRKTSLSVRTWAQHTFTTVKLHICQLSRHTKNFFSKSQL